MCSCHSIPECCVMFSGVEYGSVCFIPLERGACQGDPLSAYLFTLVLNLGIL